MNLRRYTFKLYPNRAQESALECRRALHSALYNALIQQRIEAWRRGQWTLAPASAPRVKRGRALTAFDQGKEITALRASDDAYEALSRGEMEQTVKRVDLAFRAFFRRAKQGAGASAGFPRFKRCDGFGMREMHKGGWSFADNRLVLKGVPGRIKARGRFPATPKEIRTCDLTLNGGVWWLSVVVTLPARMRAEADNHGEVDFDLIDAFARVRRTDGLCGAGSEETVYAAADGRIILPDPGVCPASGADTQEMGGERRHDTPHILPTGGADTQEMGGERRTRRHTHDGAVGADTQEMGGERREVAGHWYRVGGADTQETEGERRDGVLNALIRPGADTQETEGERRLQLICVVPIEGTGAQGTEGERRPLGLGVTSVSQRHNIEHLQRHMALCRRGSHRYRKLRQKKARLEARMARQRRETLHLWSTTIARRFAVLHIVTPPMREVTKSGHGDAREWGAQTELKAAFNRHLLAQAPALAVAMLQYKIAERGGTVSVEDARDAPAAIGNAVVTAAKATRKLRKISRHA